MIRELQQWFDRLERKKKGVLGEVRGYSAEELRFRPGVGEWSAIEVLDHLAKVERGLVDRVRRELPEGNPVTLKDGVGARMVILVMKSPMRVKVPRAAKVVLPEALASLAEVEERWSEGRKEMSELLERLGAEHLKRGLFRHPVSGWMTIAQALEFLVAHMGHHDGQLRRLKRGRADAAPSRSRFR